MSSRKQKSATSTPHSKRKARSPERGQSKQQLQPRDTGPLPAPADMFQVDPAINLGLIETPQKVYLPQDSVNQASQLVDTMPLKQLTASGMSKGRADKIHISTNSNRMSPVSNGPKTLVASAHRAAEGAGEGPGQQQSVTLVPNFRSIPPSIFNIDLNRSIGRNEPSIGLVSNSPTEAKNNQNQIYVSIHSKQNDLAAQNATSQRKHATQYQSGQNKNVKRIGPVNKGDKIKFGILIQKEQSKRKNSKSHLDFLEPHEIFETSKQLTKQTKVDIGKHSEAVNRIMGQFETYTSTKTLPTVLMSKHTSIIKQFQKNFMKETDAFSQHQLNSTMSQASHAPGMSTTVGAGYFTDGETMNTRPNGLRQKSATSNLSRKTRTFWSDDGGLMNIRDIIEQHARSVAALNKSFRPNVHLEIDEKRRKRNRELEEKGRKIAQSLNLSVHSCCTKVNRMYRCLTDEQPIRRHNKALTQLMRPNEKIIMERKQQEEDQRRKRKIDEKQHMKRKMMSLSMNAMSENFKNGFSNAARGSQPREKTIAIVKDEEQRYKSRMRPKGNREDWEQQRKDVEDSIDNGNTYSHLSRKFPMKREWAKYLVLLRKKEKDRRQKERKIKEIVEDLNEKGVVDEKLLAKELDMFEYMEYKKVRDRNRARMGAKQSLYYRPVDTERTLVIQPISMDMSDGYDDGPGGFKLEDFQGIETMFSKQSLEQRQLRVDRARERLREKRMQRLEQERLELQAEEQQLQDQYGPQRRDSAPLQQDPESRAQSSLLANISKQKEAVEAKLHKDKKEEVPKINVDDQEMQLVTKDDLLNSIRKRKRKQMKNQPPLLQSIPVQPNRTTSQDLAEFKDSTAQNTVRNQFSDFNKQQEEDGFLVSNEKKGRIRVEIASSGEGIRNIKNETLKTTSQVRDYSLEDGGIFEKKTVIANTSLEEAKHDDSLSQRSLAMLAAQGSSIHDEDKIDSRSQQELIKAGNASRPFDSIHDSADQRTETVMRQLNDYGQVDKETELMDQEDAKLNNDSQQYDMGAAQPQQQVKGNSQFSQQQVRVRPSTTENIRRNIMKNRRRQLMSGYNANQFDHLRGSAPAAEYEQARFGQYQTQTQKSAGVITTVQQYGTQNHAQIMMNQNSSDPRQFQPTALANTASSAFITDQRPSNGQLQATRTDFEGGVVNLAESQARQFSAGIQTQSGLTNAPTMEDWRSADKVVIWKEMMRYKEDHEIRGKAHIDRNMIKQIRNRVRKQRRKTLKRKSQMMFSGQGIYNQNPSDLAVTNDFTNTSYGKSNHQIQNPFQPGRENQAMEQHTIISEGTNVQSNEITPVNQSHDVYRNNFVNAQQNQPLNFKDGAQRVQVYKQQMQDGRYATQQVQRGAIQEMNVTPLATTIDEHTTTDNEAQRQRSPGDTITTTNHDFPSQDGFIQYPEAHNMKGTFVLGTLPSMAPKLTHTSMVESDQNLRKDFLQLNKSCVRENSIKRGMTSHMSRIRQMRNMRRNESIQQARLSENMTRSSLNFNQKIQLGMKNRMKNYPISLQRLKSTAKAYTKGNFGSSMSTSMMYPSFQDQLQDRRSMKVFKCNELSVDPEIVNKFTRNEAWNKTLNCPYYGLMSLRKSQERPINSEQRQENILQPFTLGNKRERTNIGKVKSAIIHRNKLREMDEKVYNLIDLCQKSNKIEWRDIYDKNEEFRDTQKKKMQESQPLSLDDLVELARI